MNRDDLRAWWETPLGREQFRRVSQEAMTEHELKRLMEWASDPLSVPKPVELIQRLQTLIAS